MGRKLYRVPLDFDAPIGKVWQGYITPPEFQFPKCGDCDGEGYGPEARAIANTFYAHMIPGGWDGPGSDGRKRAEALAWADKLGQAEVDNLITKGRLRVWRDGKWRKEKRTADDVNELQRRGGLDTHDAVNRWILVEFRCKKLAITIECPTCGGQGDIATDEQRAAAEAWTWTEPPTGDGYQLWETTSEGSPSGPVFDTLEALCEWAADNATTFASARATAAEWRAMLDKDFVFHDAGNGQVFI